MKNAFCVSVAFLLTSLVLLGGCKEGENGSTESAASTKEPATSAKEPVVLYCSVDETFATEVIKKYEEKTGRKVTLVGDTEAGKTTGLVNKIRMEKDRPRADVFWSSEQSQTILLAREGLFAPYESPSAKDIPDIFKDKERLWIGFATRARVVAYNPEVIAKEKLPKRWEEFGDPKYAKDVAIANPLFGTTRGHVAAMHSLWGKERFTGFLKNLVEAKATVADGNSTAVRKLIAGEVKLAMTDSDDVITAKAKGHKVEMIFPDMGDGGTMLIPNTVGLVKGAPHAEDAKLLIDYILSAQVEEMLAKSESGNYPVRAELQKKLGMEFPPVSKVDYYLIADNMDPAIAICREILLK